MDIVEKKEDVRLSYIDVSTLTGHEDVFSYGPRATIAFQVFQALRELGLLDDEVSSLVLDRDHEWLLTNNPRLQLFPHAQGKLEVNSSSTLHRFDSSCNLD